ncbi:MAG: tetratricopeptide repeat protein, partial [Cyclobacteriaceae bacterium]|nr:tetratricopeptide repeat protein [Cyclobacteriaceae bacterium]
NTYFELQDYNNAISNYNYVIKLNVSNAEAYYQRGRAEHSQKRLEQAIEDYSTAIAYNEKDGTYFFYRGHAKMDMGNKNGACLDWYEAGALGYYENFDKIRSICE